MEEEKVIEDNLIEDKKFKELTESLTMKILVKTNVKFVDMLNGLSSFSPKPRGFRREKKQKFMWILAFNPIDREKVLDFKKNHKFFKIGDIEVQNLNFGNTNFGINGRVFQYYIDVGIDFYIPEKSFEKALIQKGVLIFHLEKEKYKNFETGVISILAGSLHKDGEVQVNINGSQFKMCSLLEKLKKKKKYRQKEVSNRLVLPQEEDPVSPEEIPMEEDLSESDIKIQTKKKKKKKKVLPLKLLLLLRTILMQ